MLNVPGSEKLRLTPGLSDDRGLRKLVLHRLLLAFGFLQCSLTHHGAIQLGLICLAELLQITGLRACVSIFSQVLAVRYDFLQA